MSRPFATPLRRCVRRPDRIRRFGANPGGCPAGPFPPRRFLPLLAGLLLLLCGTASRAADRLLLQGLADGEIWNTDARSELFSRDGGETAPLGRLRLYSAVVASDRLQGFAQAAAQGGEAAAEGQTEVRLEQAYLRATFPTSRPLILQAGRLTIPYGSFSRRYFSSLNPLVGSPLNYEISYSYGLQVNGSAGRFDYMGAILAGPLTRQEYLSDTSTAPRAALEAGVTPLAGLRLGAYLTRGSYLGRDAAPSVPPGAAPGDYHERVAGFDLQFSRAHFELNGEFTSTTLEIPGAGTPRRHVAYLEPKITWSPRWFAALRLEQGRLVSTEPEIGAPWTVEEERIRDLEAGIGFRVDPRFLVKASCRTGFAGGATGTETADGNAFALQLSYSFDAVAWFTSPR